MSKIILLFICLKFGAASAQVQIKLIGFQNIPWGTSLKEIATKNPNLKIVNKCRNDDKIRELAKRTNESCRYLSDGSYIVESIPFVLSYEFDYLEKVKAVSLSNYRDEGIYPDEDLTKTCSNNYESIIRLLDLRYGSSLNVSNNVEFFYFKKSELRAWLPLPTEISIAKLSNHIFETNEIHPCEVRVRYTRRVPIDAGKL